ncbi:hypothetical protein ITI46_18905 [Streptomyces oryzae]|uniref:Hydrogenase expression protein HypF n=1 Tax=Streptomyces oryzae TaxID=1434886 RepID=A0ABS3XEA5_9ACTN|nr:hypothetical protein [Streptomyces oryzae]
MPGDEVHEGEGVRDDAAPGARGRTGPRHAAPRKPLLTRFHLPAGKAIALAAMPSAVLMGVGLTPQLANAKPLPKNPFKGDSCVSVSEQQETEKEKKERKERAEKLKEDLARAKAEREKAAKEAAEKAKEGADGAEKKTGDSGGDSSSGASEKPSDGSSGSTQPTPSPSPSSGSGDSSSSPSEDDKDNPWYDPLGVGDTLDGVLSPDKDSDQPADEPSSTPTPTPSPSTGSGSDSGSGDKSPAPDSGSGSGSDSDSRKSGSADEQKSGSDSASEKKSESGEKDSKDSKGDKDSKDSGSSGVDEKDGTARDYDPAKDAGKPFPCPEKTSVDGKDEQTPAQVPNDPWYLEASSLTLMGLDYEGVVNIRKPNGETKQALKFTADAVDIGDLHQLVKDRGLTYHVQAAEGSTSTIRGGKVTMYTEELKGKLFGLIPVTFTPETPPPLNVPYAYFTDVSVRQAGQFGGTLTVPGLHQSISK